METLTNKDIKHTALDTSEISDEDSQTNHSKYNHPREHNDAQEFYEIESQGNQQAPVKPTDFNDYSNYEDFEYNNPVDLNYGGYDCGDRGDYGHYQEV